MKTLLHTCCAPCSVMCIEILKAEGINPVLYWYNPNIHPLKEFRARKNALTEYAASIGVKVIYEHEYGLRHFIEGVYPEFETRCAFCYRDRLFKIAEFAKNNGFDAFTSTLFISPYQNHELMKKIAEEAAKTYEIEFLYRDFRPFFKEGQEKAREKGLYMQKFCGCIFSEEDRYKKK